MSISWLEYHRYTPRTDAHSDLRAAEVVVSCGDPVGPLVPVWAAVGWDEINWTYTRRGRSVLAKLSDGSAHRYLVRVHNIFTSGTGMSLPHWGSGNVFHRLPTGEPTYDFTISDQVFDAIVQEGHRPLVEIGFTPLELVDPEDLESFPWQDSPSNYSRYESSGWSYPPRDRGEWCDLVGALVSHALERYGADEVRTWVWELWNEPDIFYWRGSVQEYFELYRDTVATIRAILPDATVGGPATTGDPSGPRFLREFLALVDANDAPFDFLSFHTKGAYFDPIRTYGPTGGEAPEPQSPSSLKMLREVRDSVVVLQDFESLRSVDVIVDECDASVPAHIGAYDNSNFGYRNTEYFPVFQAKLMKKVLDLGDQLDARIVAIMIWAFYFEGARMFEGFRTLVTNGDIDKPVLNAYRCFAKLQPLRYAAVSDAAWSLERLDDGSAGMAEEVDALATGDGNGRYSLLVWRHADDRYLQAKEPATVRIALRELPDGVDNVAITRWLVDEAYSNSHTAWQEMGAPMEPSPTQIERLRHSATLQTLGSETVHPVTDGTVELDAELRLPALMLIEARPV